MDPNIIKSGNTITRTVVIPIVSEVNPVDDITVELTIPAGFSINTATPDVGSFIGTTWTITTLAANTPANLELILEASVDCPTGKEFTATVSVVDDSADSDPTDNVSTITLDYITCCEIKSCGDERFDAEGNGYKIQLEGDDESATTPRGGTLRSGIVFTDNVEASGGYVGLNEDPALVIEGEDAVLVGVGNNYMNITEDELVIQGGNPLSYGGAYVTSSSGDREIPDLGVVRDLFGTVDRGVGYFPVDGDGYVTIPHALGIKPNFVLATAFGDGIFYTLTYIDVDSDASEIFISVFDNDSQSSPPSSTQVGVSWEARVV